MSVVHTRYLGSSKVIKSVIQKLPTLLELEINLYADNRECYSKVGTIELLKGTETQFEFAIRDTVD